MPKVRLLKTICLLIVIFIFIGFNFSAKAATSAFIVNANNNYKVNDDITIVVSLNSTDNYNGYEINIAFTNLIYQSLTVNETNWFYFSSPTVTTNTISHSAVTNSFGDSYTGTKEIMTIKFKAPPSIGSSSIIITGDYFLFSNPGVPVQIDSSALSFKIISNRFPGDVNNDGKVNLSDLGLLAQNWNKTTATGDLNDDGKVDLSDLSILAENWNKSM